MQLAMTMHVVIGFSGSCLFPVAIHFRPTEPQIVVVCVFSIVRDMASKGSISGKCARVKCFCLSPDVGLTCPDSGKRFDSA